MVNPGFATNLEHAGDVVDKGLLGVIAKQIKRSLMFDPAETASLLHIVDRLVSNLRSAAALLVTGDDRAARLLVEEKEVFRGLEAEATAAHFEHLRGVGSAGGNQRPEPGRAARPKAGERASGRGRGVSGVGK